MFKTPIAAFALSCLPAMASAADISIEQFAPQSSVLVFSHPGAEQIIQRLDGSPMMKMLSGEGEMSEMEFMDLDEVLDRGAGPMADAIRKMKDDGDLLENFAKIRMGVALYASEDAETGGVLPHSLMFMDFSSQGDEVREAIRSMVEDAGRDGGELMDVAGRECLVMSPEEPEMPQGGGFQMGPDLSALQSMDTYICLDEEQHVLLVTTSVSGMERAVEALEGESVSDPLADSDVWKGVNAMIGEGGPSVVLMTAHLGDMVSAFDSSGMMGFMGGTLVAATGKIDAIGVRFDAGAAPSLVNAHAAIYMPDGKSGIIELISKNTDREPIPALLETEIYGMSRYNFDFNGILDWIKGVIRSNPFIQAQGMQAIQQIEPTLAAMFDSMDGTMIGLTSISRPIKMDSVISITAMQSSDTQKFNDAFTMFAGDMGMVQGDFQGHTIYTLDNAGMGMPSMPGMFSGAGTDDMAVAMGGDYVMMGNRSGIEEALRRVGERGELALTPNLEAALSTLPDRPLSGWSVQDVFRLLNDTMEVDELQMKQSLKELAEDDPELAEEIRAEMMEERAGITDLYAEMAQRLGGYSLAMWSTDNGMRMQFSLLEVMSDEE